MRKKSSSRKSFRTSRKAFNKAGRRTSLKKRIEKIESRIGQKHLAEMLGVSPRSVRRYKQGTRIPRYGTIFKIKRIEKVAKGIRKTKSIKRKARRAEKIVKEHPEIIYFETRQEFKYAETEHIILRDIHFEDIDGLLGYLSVEGCEAAYFVVKGIDTTTRKEVFYSTEIMSLDDFSSAWEESLQGILEKYDFSVSQIDLIGIRYNAPSTQEGQKELLFYS